MQRTAWTPTRVVRAPIERIRLEAAGVPRLCQLGLAILLVGGAGDLAYHLSAAPVAQSLEAALGVGADRAHVVTLAGMVVLITGVLGRGIRLGRTPFVFLGVLGRNSASATQKRSTLEE